MDSLYGSWPDLTLLGPFKSLQNKKTRFHSLRKIPGQIAAAYKHHKQVTDEVFKGIDVPQHYECAGTKKNNVQ